MTDEARVAHALNRGGRRREGVRMLRLVTATLVAAFVALPASALRLETVERRCPIDHTRFKSVVVVSQSIFCVRLDLRQVGANAEPPPLHECPEEGFVWYDGDFSPFEIDSLRGWVESGEFETQLRNESHHYRLAKIYERLGRDPWEISTAYRHAAWEVERRDPERYRRDLRESLSQLLRSLGGGSPGARLLDPNAEREAREILAGELERQLGDFEAALADFTALRKADGFVEDRHRAIVRYELELIAARDRAPHAVPGADDASCALDRARGPRAEPGE